MEQKPMTEEEQARFREETDRICKVLRVTAETDDQWASLRQMAKMTIKSSMEELRSDNVEASKAFCVEVGVDVDDLFATVEAQGEGCGVAAGVDEKMKRHWFIMAIKHGETRQLKVLSIASAEVMSEDVWKMMIAMLTTSAVMTAEKLTKRKTDGSAIKDLTCVENDGDSQLLVGFKQAEPEPDIIKIDGPAEEPPKPRFKGTPPAGNFGNN